MHDSFVYTFTFVFNTWYKLPIILWYSQLKIKSFDYQLLQAVCQKSVEHFQISVKGPRDILNLKTLIMAHILESLCFIAMCLKRIFV